MKIRNTKSVEVSKQEEEIQKKIDEQIKNIKAAKIDYQKIIEIGREQGFLNEENRKQIWPTLLEINLSKMPNQKIMNEDQQSKFYDQLKKDIDRSIAFLDSFQNEESSKIKKQQQKLFRILEGLMQKQPELQYYQGYHDVATLFLLIFGNTEGYYMTEKAANTFFRQAFQFKNFLEVSKLQQCSISTKYINQLIYRFFHLSFQDSVLIIILFQTQIPLYILQRKVH
ncbi:hypothetical protein ABPG72_013298 [Tetrahymena utriculariae]